MRARPAKPLQQNRFHRPSLTAAWQHRGYRLGDDKQYLNHLPLYRLEQIAAREQVTLSRSTLAEWVDRTGVALQPLIDRLIWHFLKSGTLHADETPVVQLEPGNGKTRKAYL